MRSIAAGCAFALIAIVAGGPARAEAVNTPECQRDLAAAVKLINGIQAREKRFVPGKLEMNCRLLKQNLVDMEKAQEPMNRCLTGREHSETVAQLDASIEDIRAVLDGNCQK